MKAFAVALVVVCVCFVGARADAVDVAASGTKVFLKDCALRMNTYLDQYYGFLGFHAYDSGSECDEYFVRGVSMVTASGSYGFNAYDVDASYAHESISVGSDRTDFADFAYGTVDVYIPYRSRCDRYRLYANNAVRFLDSRPCGGLPTLQSGDHGGYTLDTAPGHRSVRAGFRVTSGTCDGQVSITGQGVGLGFQHDAWLNYFCDSDGDLHYLAGVQVGGGTPAVAEKPTAVGDQIRLSITISGTTATATVRNVTKGWTQTKSGPAGSPSPARIGSFSDLGIGPLTQFSPVVFTNVTVGGDPLGQWVSRRVLMAAFEDIVQVQPSAITNGNSFTNTWKHA